MTNRKRAMLRINVWIEFTRWKGLKSENEKVYAEGLGLKDEICVKTIFCK